MSSAEAEALHAFDADTAVRRTGERTYDPEITGRWNSLAGGPLVGYSAAVCLRALGTDGRGRPVVVAASFVRPATVRPNAANRRVTRACSCGCA